ncbi:MAG: hypothetical protein MK000_08780 [Anaerolineales bacterium]|nr:hypothetical protein [Anaerolineales bacterium]
MTDFKISNLWSTECSPFKYAIKCAVMHVVSFLIVAVLINATGPLFFSTLFDQFTEALYGVGFVDALPEIILYEFIIGGAWTSGVAIILTLPITWLLSTRLRRGRHPILAWVEKVLMWVWPLYFFIRYYFLFYLPFLFR